MRRVALPARASRSTIPAVLAILACTLLPLRAAPSEDEVVFESPDLRIYRALDRDGRGILVLTNVDEEGQFLPGRRSAPETTDAPRAAVGPCPGATATVPDTATAETERPAVAEEIEARPEESGGTTIVININQIAPAPPEAAPAMVYPVLALGGLPGPFRYPDHLHFLGYGHGIGSPSLFGGLGLNAGNRFGLKTGVPCEQGYDCLFGPQGEHP